MSRYQLGLYEKSMPKELTIKEKLFHTKKAGFDYMELSIDESDEKLARLHWSESEIRDVYQAMWETGICLKSICLSGHRKYPLGHPDPKVQEISLDIMKKAIQLASKLGIRLIQIAGYDVYYEQSTAQTKANFSENLKKSVELAAREGITLAFETMETEFMNTIEKAMKWVNEINSPFLQIYPDIGNITNSTYEYGVTPSEDLMTGAGHLAAVHLKETVPGIYREVPFGQGHVDFYTAAKKCFMLGVRMFVGEFWHTGESNWAEILTQNNKFLREVLDQAEATVLN